MPIYEYRCDKCDTTIERIQKFSDPILTVCEVCGGPLRKLLGKPALQFKGSGFYITDYAKKGMSGPSSGDSDSSSGEKKSSPEPIAAPAASTEKSGTEPKPA